MRYINSIHVLLTYLLTIRRISKQTITYPGSTFIQPFVYFRRLVLVHQYRCCTTELTMVLWYDHAEPWFNRGSTAMVQPQCNHGSLTLVQHGCTIGKHPTSPRVYYSEGSLVRRVIIIIKQRLTRRVWS